MRALIETLAVAAAIGVGFFIGRSTSAPQATAAARPETVPAKQQAVAVESPEIPAAAAEPSAPSAPALEKCLLDLNPLTRRQGLEELAVQAARRDPHAAWQMLSAINGLADQQVFAEKVALEWAKKSPAHALDAIKRLPAGELQAGCSAIAVGQWATQSPTEALAYADSKLTGAIRQMAVTSAAAQWARSDVAAAAQWALSRSASSRGLQAIDSVMAVWGETDPVAGAQWVAALPEGAFKRNARQSLLRQWTDQFPAEAAAWVSQHPADGSELSEVAATWAKADAPAAANWAAGLADPSQRQQAVQQTLAEWSAVAPQEALQWLASRGLTNEANLAQVLQTWAADDPKEAYAWAAARSPALAQSVTQQWAAFNPEGFLQWSQTLPEASRGDPLRSLVALAMSEKRPADAIKQAAAIGDAALRTESLERVLAEWEKTDPKAAADWRKLNLPTP